MMTLRIEHSIVLLLSLLLSACFSASAQETICLEAEWAASITPPMELIDATDDSVARGISGSTEASGRKYVEIAQGRGNPPAVDAGDAHYSFEVKQGGTFILWCRVWWDNECGNSFSMNLDENKPFAFGQDSTFKRWHWVKAPPRLKQLEFSKGKHTLIVKNREDGVRLDQILLTTDSRYIPVGIEDATPAAKVETHSPAASESAK